MLIFALNESKTCFESGASELSDITTSKSARKKFLQPQRLTFHLTSTASTIVKYATQSARDSISDLDLHVFGYDVFGKGEIKKFGISPDAFLQMALQLAYYRDSEGNHLFLSIIIVTLSDLYSPLCIIIFFYLFFEPT